MEIGPVLMQFSLGQIRMYMNFMVTLLLSTITVYAENFNGNLSNGVADERQLLEKLQNSIPKYTPPYDMENKTVYFYLEMLQILNVDQKMGIWEVKFFVDIYYYTPSAKWDPKEYGNGTLDAMVVPAGTFWTPDLGGW